MHEIEDSIKTHLNWIQSTLLSGNQSKKINNNLDSLVRFVAKLL